MTDEQNAAAVLAALNATLPGALFAYDVDDLPDPRPQDYLEVAVSRRFGGESRESGQKVATGYRVTTRAVAQTVSNARSILGYAKTALEAKMLTVSGAHTTPIQFETEDPIGPDDGYYSGLVAWTYVI